MADKFDVLVYGATSFVGQILCRYLIERTAGGARLRWAMAGRSAGKLEEVRRSLGEAAANIPLQVADAADEQALRALVASTRVIVSTVGPYALHGEPLVRACAEAGVDYCDLTGEVQWIRRMIERYEDLARRNGARIVHCCGFDSIPSDLGVHFLQQQSLQAFGEPCEEINMRVRAMRGGFSGGTAASLLNVAREVSANPALRKELANPYSLCQLGVAAEGLVPVRQRATRLFARDSAAGGWVSPFIMAAINTRIVHRSNALSAGRYSRAFRYDEAVSTGRGLRGRLTAVGAGVGLSVFMLASALGPTRAVLQRLLPAPGEGPSPEAQARGFFDLRFFGRTASGRQVRVKVTGDRDPGYGSTAKMLGEAAMCLAFDVPRDTVAGGFWTPATIFGDRLVARLEAHAGLRFERQQ
ncbi:MAG: hypothetical protein RLZZ473_1819 [Pseudomonadota bacterium]